MTAAELRQEQHEEDVRAWLSTAQGRRVFWHLVDGLGRLHGASFSGEQSHLSAYLEGRRSVAIELMGEAMRVAPVRVTEAIAEALEADRLRGEAAAK